LDAAALQTYIGIWLARFEMKILNKSNRIANFDAMMSVILITKMKTCEAPPGRCLRILAM
jgi:hypothetical protein